MGKRRFAIVAVVAVAGLLRLHGALSARLTFDESLTLALAEPVAGAAGAWSVGPSDHPPVGHWAVRASGALFGMSDAGLRGLSVLCGAVTVLLVYLLGRRLWGERTGLLAAALLAVDRFHASWSRLLVEESPLQMFAALALLLTARAVGRPAPCRLADWAAVGVAIGLAALAKETALLLLPALALALLATAAGRRSLRGFGPGFATLLAVAAAGLELMRSAPHFPAGIVGRALLLAEWTGGPSPIATSPYLGELYRWLMGPEVLDSDYAEGAAFAAFWPVGLFYLVAVLAALRHPAPADRLPLVVFWVVFVFFTLTGGRDTFDPFWWASLSVVPAVLLAGRLIDRALAARPRLRVGLFAALGSLAVATAVTLARPGLGAPRVTREEWARRVAEDGARGLDAGDLGRALTQAQLSATMDPEGPGRALLLRLCDSPEAVHEAPRFLGAVRSALGGRGAPEGHPPRP